MPQKRVVVPELGEVLLVKKRGARSIRLTIPGNTSVRVSMPPWLPYGAALQFLHSKKEWIKSHLERPEILKNGQLIGKSHRLMFVQDNQLETPKSRVTPTTIEIRHSGNSDEPSAQEAAKKASLRALKKECETLMPEHVASLAARHGFTYRSLNYKRLTSRWGSCSHDKRIVLNIFLMQLPWPLIDYVILHELTHTQQLNHGRAFWQLLESCLPTAKNRRKELKAYHPYF